MKQTQKEFQVIKWIIAAVNLPQFKTIELKI